MPLTPFDSIVILTEHRYDAEALGALLGSKERARFVGMIGSKNRVNTSYKELIEHGAPTEKLFTVYAPVGLDIGAVTPQEIAVSIMAEIIQVRRGGSLNHLRLTKFLEKPEPTHSLTAKGSERMQVENMTA
jgi:xanthine dehydrogenase accessory factor